MLVSTINAVDQLPRLFQSSSYHMCKILYVILFLSHPLFHQRPPKNFFPHLFSLFTYKLSLNISLVTTININSTHPFTCRSWRDRLLHTLKDTCPKFLVFHHLGLGNGAFTFLVVAIHGPSQIGALLQLQKERWF